MDLAISAPKTVNTKEYFVQFIFDAIARVVDQLNLNGFVNGVHIDDVVVTAGTAKIIEHKLRKAPRGVVVVKQNANAVVWQPSPPTATTVTLQSSATVTVSIWVYV